MTMHSDRSSTHVRVWDLPIRLFHWSLAALVATSIISGLRGKLDVHMVLGLCVLALILFRLAWGVVGSETARFSQFVRGPRAVLDYLHAAKAGKARSIGHNPLGAYSVLALLGILLAQAATGLFTSDDIATDGPLTYLISSKMTALLSTLHRVGFKALLGLLGLHLAAVAFYTLVKKDDLLLAMLTGDKKVPAGVVGITSRSPLLALILLAAAMATVWGGLMALGR